MKLKSIKIKNFRGIRDEITLSINDLTVLIGKNDVGKSTILEALDIFFNECKSGYTKIDKNDVNVYTESDVVSITGIFNDVPELLILDTTVETNLENEFLLNIEGLLEVKKQFKGTKLTDTFIVSNFPVNEELTDIHAKKIAELREIVNERGITVEDSRKSSLLRKAIFDDLAPTDFTVKEINAATEGGKQIWTSLSKYIPLYMLFQSDRKNEDKDNEIQDPMKFAIEEVLKREEITNSLERIYVEVEQAIKDLATKTLEKLQEMNPEIAEELKPTFKKPNWSSVFGFGLESESNIPVNKRGSGVRRLILLNFFRAEAERRKDERGVPNIIYAYEEPETSQHPNHQKILMDSFIELSNQSINQILLTTHSPEIAKMVHIDSLRMLKELDQGVEIVAPSNDILKEITEALGVLPTFALSNVSSVKVAICVEGANDISFLKAINDSIPELRAICDINSPECILLPMGGSTLKYWVNNEYLKKLNLFQVHIYDSDIGSDQPYKYRSYIDQINATQNAKGFETTMREMENYITPDVLINELEGLDTLDDADWVTLDVPELIAKHIHEQSESPKTWDELTEDKQKKKISRAKVRVNTEFANNVTKENLENYNCFEEVKTWFDKISELANL
jgi:AAA15 family ATPase/GTPase